MHISINYVCPENSYAADELSLFLNTYTNNKISINSPNADKTVCLALDKSLPEQHYVIVGNGTSLQIRGGNRSSVLCGVYEALADSGIVFEATGHSVPKEFSVSRFFGVNKSVCPKFRLRGIRQHINFPMDVSSYPLSDAKEYFRALARMRYNAITFHSYPGQWHERKNGADDDYAGHFFYGHTNYVPNNDPISAAKIKNRKIYCIPEAEAIFEDEEKRGEFAKYWLNEVMQTVKDAGMKITLSVEVTSDDDGTNIAMLRNVCESYPLIDTLELITEENGGEAPEQSYSAEELPSRMVAYFGNDILDDNGNLPGYAGILPPHFSKTAHSLYRAVNMLKKCDEWLGDIKNQPELRLGIYETGTDTLNILRPIIRKRLPKGATMSLLPAHGALTVANNIEVTGTTPEDWQNTMFYSWAEFDGNMFMQQMSTDGLERLVSMPSADSAYGFAINHWRTSENNMAISYAAEAAITGIGTEEFYKLYAARMGINAPDEFASVCNKLADLDTFNRDRLFNIGFCAVWCWLDWCRTGDIYKPRCYSPEDQTTSLNAYLDIISEFEKVLAFAETKEAIAFIRLMINRCGTSVIHLQFMMELDKLAEIYDYDAQKALSKEDSARACKILETAKSYLDDYMHLYGDILADRGAEGHIVSYNDTALVYYKAIAATFTGEKFEINEKIFDSPPPPDELVK